jgi:hypothetical protein
MKSSTCRLLPTTKAPLASTIQFRQYVIVTTTLIAIGQCAFSRKALATLSAFALRSAKMRSTQVHFFTSHTLTHKRLILIAVDTAMEREIVRAAVVMGCSNRYMLPEHAEGVEQVTLAMCFDLPCSWRRHVTSHV